MSTVKELFGTSNQGITCTLASLGSGSARQSTVIDNSSNLFVDTLVTIKVKTATVSGNSPFVNVYAYGTADGGTTYSDGATGTDGAITLSTPPNMRLIGTINAPASTTTYVGGPFSVAAAFGGVLPEKWGIVVENKTGAALDATEGNHAKFYQGVYQQLV